MQSIALPKMMNVTMGFASALSMVVNVVAQEVCKPNVTREVRNVAKVTIAQDAVLKAFPELVRVISDRLDELDEFDTYVDKMYEIHGNSRAAASMMADDALCD